MKATLTVLGSGTSMGVPTIGCDCAVCRSSDPRDRRTRPSVLIEYGGKNVLIDTTPDFRQQAIRDSLEDERQKALAIADAARQPIFYVVSRGDALELIARQYNVTIEELQEWNALPSPGIRVGQRLLEAFLEQARNDGVTRVHLEVRDGNPAVSMYRNVGFSPVGRRRNYYHGLDGKRFDAVTLAHRL